MNIIKKLVLVLAAHCCIAIHTQLAQETATRLGYTPSQDIEQFNVGRQLVTQKGILQWREELEVLQYNRGSDIYWENRLVYGLTERFGLQIRFPVYLHRKIDQFVSRGLSDILLETQWEFYHTQQQTALFFSGVSFPTGDTTTLPTLGTGSFDPVLAFFFAHSSQKWFFSATFGTQITNTRKRSGQFAIIDDTVVEITSIRDSSVIDAFFLFGPKITFASDPDKTLGLFWELFGIHLFRAKINEVEQRRSGGTAFVTGPFFSFEQRDKFVIQGWIQLPVSQRIFHSQPRGIFAQPKLDMVVGISMEGYF